MKFPTEAATKFYNIALQNSAMIWEACDVRQHWKLIKHDVSLLSDPVARGFAEHYGRRVYYRYLRMRFK